MRGGVEIEVLTNGGNFSDYPLVTEDPGTEIALRRIARQKNSSDTSVNDMLLETINYRNEDPQKLSLSNRWKCQTTSTPFSGCRSGTRLATNPK